jgi:hypothetical protein
VLNIIYLRMVGVLKLKTILYLFQIEQKGYLSLYIPLELPFILFSKYHVYTWYKITGY